MLRALSNKKGRMNTQRDQMYSPPISVSRESATNFELLKPSITPEVLDKETILLVGPRSFELGHTFSPLDNKVISLSDANQMFVWLKNRIKNLKNERKKNISLSIAEDLWSGLRTSGAPSASTWAPPSSP